MDDKTHITYNGTPLPGNAEVVTLFNSTTAYGKGAAPHYRCFWVDVAFQAGAAGGTVGLQKSVDGGVNWITVGTPTAVTLGHFATSFWVSPYSDFRVLFTNGATPQPSFAVELVIDHNSRGSLAQA